MNDPWTWTTGWGLTVGEGVGGAGESNRGKLDNCNRKTIKKVKKRKKTKTKSIQPAEFSLSETSPKTFTYISLATTCFC